MYKYVGTSFLVGVPARDITKQEFETLTKEQQEAVKNSGLYELAKEKTK